jgi:hypothetical protein
MRTVKLHTKIHKNWFKHSKVGKGVTQTAWRSHKPTLILKIGKGTLRIFFLLSVSS